MHELGPQLKDGSDWQQNDRCIVGDEAGLKNLIKACEKAIESGEYIGSDLGDYVGVKKLASQVLAEHQEHKATPFVLAILFASAASFCVLAVVGLVTVWNWW